MLLFVARLKRLQKVHRHPVESGDLLALKVARLEKLRIVGIDRRLFPLHAFLEHERPERVLPGQDLADRFFQILERLGSERAGMGEHTRGFRPVAEESRAELFRGQGDPESILANLDRAHPDIAVIREAGDVKDVLGIDETRVTILRRRCRIHERLFHQAVVLIERQ